MNQGKNVERSIPGKQKQCSGNKYCAARAPFYSTSLLCVGAPTSQIMGECTLCKRFICGRCANIEFLELEISGLGFRVCWLACPRCGCHLGRTQEKAILWSSKIGVVGTGSFDGQELNLNIKTLSERSATLSNLRTAFENHEQRSDILTHKALTAPSSPPETLATLEEATLESPNNIIAWFYRALLCMKLGLDESQGYQIRQPGKPSIQYDIAVKFAMDEVRRLGRKALLTSEERWMAEFPNVSSFWKVIADPVYEALSKM